MLRKKLRIARKKNQFNSQDKCSDGNRFPIIAEAVRLEQTTGTFRHHYQTPKDCRTSALAKMFYCVFLEHYFDGYNNYGNHFSDSKHKKQLNLHCPECKLYPKLDVR